MSSDRQRRLEALEATIGPNLGPWCPECGHGQQVLIIHEGEPEPICGTCGRPKARGQGIRIIEITRVASATAAEPQDS